MSADMTTSTETATAPRARPARDPNAEASLDVSVVLPVFNEVGNLEALDGELRQALAAAGSSAEIIYVDDHSTDGSDELLLELMRAAGGGEPRTRVVTLRRNYGQTAALAAGFDLAEGEVVIPLDADGQNNPADIPRLLAKLEEGYDVVSGWRRSREDRLFSRRIPSMSANWLISKVSKLPLHDAGCTLKAYRRSLLKEVRLYGDMHRFIPIFLAFLGARVAEIEVDHRPRRAGVSKYGGDRVFKVLVDMVLLHFMSKYYTRPMHYFGRLAAFFLGATALVTVLMAVFKYGWLSMIGIDYQASFTQTPLPALAATFLLGTVSSLFFGILAEILIRIHHESGGFSVYGIHRIDDSKALGPATCAE
jgi:glycosyltransferase involved in cell wall biosynthesis